MTENQIFQVLTACERTYLSTPESIQKKEKAYADAKILISTNPYAKEILIKKTSNTLFRKIARVLDLPKDIVLTRENLEKNILNNFQNYSVQSIQEAFCDLMYNDNSKNVRLKLETLKEHAENFTEFVEYKNFKKFYEKTLTLLSYDETTPKEEVSATLKELSILGKDLKEKNIDLPDAFKKLYGLAESNFQKDLETSLNKTKNTVLEGVTPDTLQTQYGEVKVYKIKNQTKNQADFKLLISSKSAGRHNTEVQEQDILNLIERQQSKSYLSYSLISPSHFGSFNKYANLIFGYFGTNGEEVWSANVFDGQTNQSTLEKGKYIIKQQLLPVDEFVKQTDRYNEIVLTNANKSIPDVLISPTEIPNDATLLFASMYNLPILFIDKTCYIQQEPARNVENGSQNWFDNYTDKLKSELAPINLPEDEDLPD